MKKGLMQNKRVITFVALAAITILATGCPEITLTEVGIKADSATEDGFTLTGSVKVVEEDPGYSEHTIDEKGKQQGGHGMLALWLPQGWSPKQVRTKGPKDTVLIPLVEIKQSIENLPRTFPHTAGAWWLFATDCMYPPIGTSEYQLEADIQTPPGTTEGNVGVIVTGYSEEEYGGAPPKEIKVDLGQATATIVDSTTEQANATDEKAQVSQKCRTISPVSPVTPGPRGCSCRTLGTKLEANTSLVKLAAFLWGF
jgi:hypothetical protein